MINKKVSAFTILEVTIAMLIAALLIGITYTAYSIIVKSYSSFNRKNQDMAVLVRLDEWLKKDFDHADTVLKDTAGIMLCSADRRVKYQFDPDFIVRTEIRADTFKIKTENIITSFEGQPVTEFAAGEEQNRLDDLSLVILFRDEKIPYHYHKQYSSANLINRNPNAVH
jgi:Tfp pilus assembly protein PilE